MARWKEPKYGVDRLYEYMKLLEKFQFILIIYEGTSFTDKQSEQKLDGIFGRNWLDEMMWIFA